MRWYVEIQVSGRTAQHYELTGLACVQCGAEKSAHVRLPLKSEFPSRLLQMTPKSDGVLLTRTQDGVSDIEFLGRRYQTVSVPWEQDAFVENLRFCFFRTDDDGRRNSLGITGGLLGCCILGILFFLSSRDADSQVSSYLDGPDAPVLWEGIKEPCGVTSGDLSIHRAALLWETARAKATRYPFEPKVGRDAVRMLAEASSCLEVAQQLPAQDRRIAEGILLEEKRVKLLIERDYAGLRLSLRFAVLNGNDSEVIRLAVKLAELLSLPPTNAYARWLAVLKREAADRLRAKGA